MAFKIDQLLLNGLEKSGNFDWENQTPFTMSKSPEQKIMELEAVKLLEKQKSFGTTGLCCR
jgi:hypothetical protein